jgi:coenzyme Q-binding protein COQ10
MPIHRVTRVLSYTPEQLCVLVGDIARYPDFVPWITSMRTWNPQVLPDGANTVDAEAQVGFSMLTERFATRVKRDPLNQIVLVSLLSGPFKRLVNEWRFTAHPDGCEIGFMIDFEFKSKLLTMMLEANFDRAVNRLIGCFEARAAALYDVSDQPVPEASPAQP